jgi:chorismate dehydratase
MPLSRLVIGAVPHLNAWPLVCGLGEGSGVELRIEAAADLGPLLRGGELDAALLPAIEYFRLSADPGERARRSLPAVAGTHPEPRIPTGRPPGGFVIVPVAAIASRGSIGSVRLFGYTEMALVRRVLLDPASRTANALARVLFGQRFGVHPHFILPDLVGPEPHRPPDAELVIGNRGLVAERPAAKWARDLGREWHRWVHRPFVYAMWVARQDAPLDTVAELFATARDAGLAAREALAARAEEELDIPADVARRHLVSEVHYQLGPREREGLRTFYRLVSEAGLAPEGVRLRFSPALGST